MIPILKRKIAELIIVRILKVDFLKKTIAWGLKNTALIVGVIEALAKLLAGIASLTPTKADDIFIPTVDLAASWIKKGLYTAADKLAGKV